MANDLSACHRHLLRSDATSANSSTVKQGDGTSAVTKAATYNRIVAVDDIVSVAVGDVGIPVSAA